MKTAIPFVIPSLRIKCLGIYLMKEVKNLYYKKLMKRIEGDQINWKTVCIHGLEGWLSLKCAIIPKAIYRFKAPTYQNSSGIFHRHRENNPRLCVELQKTPSSKSNFEKGQKSQRHYAPYFKVYYKATVIKMVRQWHKTQTSRSMAQDRQPDQAHTYGQLTCDKGALTIQWGQGSLFSKWC